MTMLITVYDLISVGACTGQLRAFQDRFGERVAATVTTAVAHAAFFDWDWAASAFLKGKYRDAWIVELASWSWDPWLDPENGEPTEDGYAASSRFHAAAFAKAFLAQGGAPRSQRFR